MKHNTNILKAQPSKSKEFAKVLQEQRDFVDTQLLVQGFLEAHNRDIRNLTTFISPNIISTLRYDENNAEYLWDFCSELADSITYGMIDSKEKTKYVGLVYNSLFISLTFVPKAKRATVLEVSDWINGVNFNRI